MTTYHRLRQDQRRPFVITAGLVPGYAGDGDEGHHLAVAVAAHAAWMANRAKTGRPYLTGLFHEATVSYAWPTDGGEAGIGVEPAAVFTGDVSPIYNRDLTDDEVEAMLDELGAELGDALGQHRVYIAYRHRTWVLEAEDAQTPTGD